MSFGRLLVIATVVSATLAIVAPIQAAPTNVELESLVVCKPTKATKTKPRIVSIRWKTGGEPDLLGFNLYRKIGAKVTKLNRSVIESKGQVAGARYRWLDRLPKTLKGSFCYRLDAVSGNGTKKTLRTVCKRISCANPGV